MAAKRVILEMGTGNDLHGGDYTKAAIRATSRKGRCRPRKEYFAARRGLGEGG
jgi:hypothetical protein